LPVAERSARRKATADVIYILRERIEALTRELNSIHRSDKILEKAWLERIKSDSSRD
jgi:hypothetical protein